MNRTDKNILKQALTIQGQDKAPRLEILESGRPIEFSRLEKMSIADLSKCRASILTIPLVARETTGANYEIILGDGSLQVGEESYPAKQNAAEIVELYYSATLAYFSGGI
ncbi:MAG: hypothetical protein WCK29_04085 [archaeon]